MNTRLKLALLLHTGESGFAMVIAVSMGLIMILVGLTMTMRSQGDQVVASRQKETDRAIGAAEKAIVHYQAFINENRLLSRHPDCLGTRNAQGVCPDTGSQASWSNPTNIPGISSTSCVGSSASTTTIQQFANIATWTNVDLTDASKGQFRLVSYRTADPGDNSLQTMGILTVEGRTGSGINESISRLQVAIPVRPPEIGNISVPGVWIGNPNDTNGTGGNTIRGNVLVNSCSVNLANIKIDPTTPEFSAQYTNLPMPTVPTMPAAANNATNPPTAGTISLGTINTNITLPRLGGATPDLPITFNGQQRYVYSATGIVKGGGNTTLTITPGQRVVIFLSGDISKNVNIDHTCGSVSGCLPTNFQIFGTKASGGEICLNGNRVVDAFILAPRYQAGVAGGGNNGGINGSIWVNNWSNGGSCGSNSNNVVVRQTAAWNDLTGLQPDNAALPPSILPIRAWQRNGVN
ncbi:hypothetical protein [Anabaena sp. UHCC 0451]|uniref:hypothetical protein n=1 Tax=Anabaena sp. UHCC 0451 TaxID=2055235 RepID=UPI002B2090E5|nr:hypothetical protein [Anabaena sp. UHCC 0451]MEA5575424.1 hypothetical protein [Anabaena sp. UHCC 0451]